MCRLLPFDDMFVDILDELLDVGLALLSSDVEKVFAGSLPLADEGQNGVVIAFDESR